MTELVFWSGDFSTKVNEWLKEKHPLFLQEWKQAIEIEEKYGYQRVTTPVLGKKELFE